MDFDALIAAMKNLKQYPFVSLSFMLMLFYCGFMMSELQAAGAGQKARKTIHFQDVVKKASVLSEQDFQAPPRDGVTEALKQITYDQWRDIRFKPQQSLWAKDTFNVQFFHLGFFYLDPVVINSVDKNGVQAMPFSPELFDYKDKSHIDKLPANTGFSGFRIHYPLNTSSYADELIAFLGASYFRALGKGLLYGLSARGIAVNTAEDIGEEFPYFREFWIVRPTSLLAREITVLALMDSKSLTGAYEFVIRPGEETLMRVKCTLFIRKPIRKLGVAPLTSMFFYGEHSPTPESDFRPEIHDSDGVLIETKKDTWIWHPVVNPRRILINTFNVQQPKGFGLIQRDINFDHYQDLEARYDRRPSVWVKPEGDWGKGHLELLQLPTVNEFNDNIVTYWVPEKVLEPKESVSYNYTLSWHSAEIKRSPLAYVESTRILRKKDSVMFLVDFMPQARQKLLSKKDLTVDINAFNNYKIDETQIIPNPVTNGLRLVIRIRLDKEGFLQDILPTDLPAIDLLAFIKEKNTAVTETWSFTYLP